MDSTLTGKFSRPGIVNINFTKVLKFPKTHGGSQGHVEDECKGKEKHEERQKDLHEGFDVNPHHDDVYSDVGELLEGHDHVDPGHNRHKTPNLGKMCRLGDNMDITET